MSVHPPSCKDADKVIVRSRFSRMHSQVAVPPCESAPTRSNHRDIAWWQPLPDCGSEYVHHFYPPQHCICSIACSRVAAGAILCANHCHLVYGKQPGGASPPDIILYSQGLHHVCFFRPWLEATGWWQYNIHQLSYIKSLILQTATAS